MTQTIRRCPDVRLEPRELALLVEVLDSAMTGAAAELDARCREEGFSPRAEALVDRSSEILRLRRRLLGMACQVLEPEPVIDSGSRRLVTAELLDEPRRLEVPPIRLAG